VGDLVSRLSSKPELEGRVIERELGRGGMGVVYLAVADDGRSPLAVKVMTPEVAADDLAHELFRREIEHCLQLSHPNLVRTFAAGESDGDHFITMEYCAGGSLDAVIDAHGPLDPAAAVAVAVDLVAALEYAHAEGVVHRDVKPHNVFLAGPQGAPAAKLGDFGLAKAFQLAGLSGLTPTGLAAGTPAFMPRQQVLNYKYATPAVDVWAAAATTYFALTGTPPRDFPAGKDPWRIVWDTAPVPLSERRDGLPSDLCRVIDEALVDDPSIGVASVAELRAALTASAP
jgi:serine/threonine protein kinase